MSVGSAEGKFGSGVDTEEIEEGGNGSVEFVMMVRGDDEIGREYPMFSKGARAGRGAGVSEAKLGMKGGGEKLLHSREGIGAGVVVSGSGGGVRAGTETRDSVTEQ